jgi:hypothetical protein
MDFRYVNNHSLGDAYPLSDPSDLIQKMGKPVILVRLTPGQVITIR